MTRLLILRIFSLYLPIAAACAAAVIGPRQPKRFAGCLLALLWTLPTLQLLQAVNQRTGWWAFPSTGIALRGMPLELLLGWAVLWGLLPQLAFPRLGVAASATCMIALDLLVMPAMRPLVLLGPHWLAGEALALFLVLLPALAICRWTIEGSHLRLRVAIQVATSALLFLYLIPEIAFAAPPLALHLTSVRSKGWSPLFHQPLWRIQLSSLLIFVLALPGVAAVMEFASRGGGTPIPYDPPSSLVTSGIYRFCANPMQLSCAIVMLAWALLLHDPRLLLPALLAIVYSAGLANWDEAEDLDCRFGQPWRDYRAHVHPWRFRVLPFHAGPAAKLYIAQTCGPCSELRSWLESRQPIGLEILPAETLPTIRRMRYDPGDGSTCEEGLKAMGRALEHIHLGWALFGAVLRLPVLTQFVQLSLDAAGLGPRTLNKSACHDIANSNGLNTLRAITADSKDFSKVVQS